MTEVKGLFRGRIENTEIPDLFGHQEYVDSRKSNVSLRSYALKTVTGDHEQVSEREKATLVYWDSVNKNCEKILYEIGNGLDSSLRQILPEEIW